MTRLLARLPALLLLLAGLAKLSRPDLFAEQILQFRLLPHPAFAAALALYLPWLEILCGALVLLLPLRHPLRPAARQLLLALLVLFTLALLAAALRGIPLDCGCFGPLMRNWPLPILLARNLALILMTRLKDEG